MPLKQAGKWIGALTHLLLQELWINSSEGGEGLDFAPQAAVNH